MTSNLESVEVQELPIKKTKSLRAGMWRPVGWDIAERQEWSRKIYSNLSKCVDGQWYILDESPEAIRESGEDDHK